MRKCKTSKRILELAKRLDDVMKTYRTFEYHDEVETNGDGVKQSYHAIVYSPLDVIDALFDIAERRM